MHRMSKVVGVKLLAAAAALGAVGWLSTDGELSAQTKSQHHPRLHRALHELRQAHNHLKEAQGNFGGHRHEALRDVDRAIQRVEQAMRHSHPTGSKGGAGVTVTGTPTRTGTSPGTGVSVSTSSPSSKTAGTRFTRGSQKGVLHIPRK